MATHTNTTSIQTAFTARAAVGGFVVAPAAKLTVVVPAGTRMTRRPHAALATS